MEEWDKYNPVAQFIRERRKELCLTQIKLADITGVGLRFVRELEQGKPSLMMNKVNQLLLFFDHTLKPIEISKEERLKLTEEE